jgi:hypothetical protein
VFLASLAAAGCERLAAKKVGTIIGEIGSYEGRTVTVIGNVQERIDVPSIKCFVLNDGTGSIGVVTKGRLPLVGQKVLAKGRVQTGFVIGSRKLTVVIEAPKPTPTVPRNPGQRSSGPG